MYIGGCIISKFRYPSYAIWLARAKRRRYWLNYIKVKCGCFVCGYNTNARALQFDHVGIKKREVSKLVMNKIKILYKEIRKCRILCANCHIINTDRSNNGRGRKVKRADT